MKLVNIHKLIFLLLLATVGIKVSHAQVWTLQQCIDTAHVHNKNLKMGRNNMAIGEQKEKEAKANLMPKITANADYRYYANLPYQLMPLSAFGGPSGEYKAIQFGVPNLINANLQFSMPLYNPQVYGSIQATKISSDITELQYLKTEEQVYFEIANLYYNAQILYHQLDFIDSNLFNAERLFKNMELLKEQLLAKGTDAGKAKLQVIQLTAQKESIDSKYRQVLNALKFAMGIAIEQPVQIEQNIENKNSNEYISISTLQNRIAKKQNLLINNEISMLNKSRWIPSLNLFGTYGTTGFGYNGEPRTFLDFYSIGFAGIQLSYPLFNGMVTQRKINQKKSELKNSELQLDILSEQDHLFTENAKMQRNVAFKSTETATEQIRLAQTIYNQTIVQQKQGNASLTDVLLADNALREAQQNYLTALVEYLKTDLELKKITGNISTIK